MVQRTLREILGGPVLDEAALREVARLPLQDREQQDRLDLQLEGWLREAEPGTIRVGIPELMRIARDPQTQPAARDGLDRFAALLFFARRPGLFGDRAVRAQLMGQSVVRRPEPHFLAYMRRRPPGMRLTFRAALHYATRDIEVAYLLFDAARRAHGKAWRIPTTFAGLRFARPLAELAPLAAAAPRRRDLQILPGGPFAHRRPIVVVGVDQTYFDRYAPRLIETGRGHVNFHFHIANPSGAPGPQGDDIRYSVETAPQSRAYYATMRFLHLPALLRHYGETLTVLDADAYFTRPLDAYRAAFDGHDIGINRNRRAPSQFFWRHLNAQILTAAPTDAGLAFLDKLAALFDALWIPDGANWWIDQALLTHALHLTRAEGRPTRVFDNRFGHLTGIRQEKLPG